MESITKKLRHDLTINVSRTASTICFIVALLFIFKAETLSANSAGGLNPILLNFYCSDNDNNYILTTHEVDRYFNTTSATFVDEIVETTNCSSGRSGIFIGKDNSQGSLSFSLKPDYQKDICRVLLDYIPTSASDATISICDSDPVAVQAPTDDVYCHQFFELNIAGGNTQAITISASKKVCIVSITIIYADSDAAAGDVESIRVPISSRTINIGERIQIKAEVTPYYALDRSLRYESNNESVATVDENGLVTALSKGTAVVSVISCSTPSVFALVTINVVEITPTAIRFKDGERTVGVGGSLQFSLEFTPENAVKDVEWSTTFSEYFDLDQTGRIYAKKESNNVNVKATSKLNENVYKYCAFSIVDYLGVESLTVTPALISTEPGEIARLSAIVTPAGASNTAVKWKSSDPSIAEVDENGNVRAIKGGECKISVTSIDNPDISAECTVTVMGSLSSIDIVGQSEEENDITITINGNIVMLENLTDGDLLEIFDMTGLCLVSRKISGGRASVALPGGKVYLISVGGMIYKVILRK